MKLQEINDCLNLDRIMGTDIAIYQSDETFKFSIDSILLAKFVNLKDNYRVLDLGTGNGVIPLTLASKKFNSLIYGVEINHKLVELANRSVQKNEYQEAVKIIVGDVRNIEEYFELESFDVVVSNPPYFALEDGMISNNRNIAYARHEINGTIKDFILATKKMLKYRGKGYFVYNSARLVDILTEFRSNSLEPKRIKLVHSKLEKTSNIFLVEVIKGASAGLRIEPSLIIYGETGYTAELLNFIKDDEK